MGPPEVAQASMCEKTSAQIRLSYTVRQSPGGCSIFSIHNEKNSFYLTCREELCKSACAKNHKVAEATNG
jgi:hypothetical protein